ncbi:M48 family metalloprotease [Methanobrevibacter cuticularis]|uniref:M48 family metalloprotease n=1 Tax=Methanobrevibacter cuticularis TaxID=47311 RepID=UPI001FDF0884|nr:M48 family metalloprotease [Methanobrevibacter cuticularis]
MLCIKKNDRSSINPFTGKKHFDILNDDKFLNQCYNEYYQITNQHELLDEHTDGKLVAKISLNLINAVENYLLEINRSDYTNNYYDWEFHLVSNDTPNAFCIPGGKILVYSGILSIANNEKSLAFILAHEMAHALLDHGRTQVSAQTAKNTATTTARLGSIGLDLLGFSEIASVVRTATNVSDIGSEYFLMKPWGRNQEMEADKLGMMIVKLAGYDISEIPNFWQKMSEINSNKHDFFSTHPSDKKRIDQMNKIVLELSNQKISNGSPILSENHNQKNSGIISALSEVSNQKISNNIPSFTQISKNNVKNMNLKAQSLIKNDVVSNKNPNFCGNCGNPLSANVKFCGKCGNKIKNNF